ncbi:hypothetical protein niasHT_032708 [Heterodera trifolii]|uniref:MATH domain-containing protein n=1 Tax=Heterodera trifolii TaxID=157864 RepID=A0ABD2IJW1_9BILA
MTKDKQGKMPGIFSRLCRSGESTLLRSDNEELLAVFQYHCHPNLRGAPGQYPMAFPCHGRISDQKAGTLTMDIEKLSEFAQERVNSSRYSDGIYIKGLPWKILAQINAKKNNEKMICKCSVTYRIVSQKSEMDETEDFTKENDHVFNNRSYSNGFAFFITFSELMDPTEQRIL